MKNGTNSNKGMAWLMALGAGSVVYWYMSGDSKRRTGFKAFVQRYGIMLMPLASTFLKRFDDSAKK